jgi:hypothetical protein
MYPLAAQKNQFTENSVFPGWVSKNKLPCFIPTGGASLHPVNGPLNCLNGSFGKLQPLSLKLL